MGDKESTCRGCGKKILWARTSDGRRIPLDPSAPVYVLLSDAECGDQNGPVVILHPAADRKLKGPWVSHFATCPQANQFSSSKVRP